MVDSYLDNSSYENLIANYYDENTMNKFAAAQEQETSIFEKIQSTPYGYEDEEPTECPTAEAGRPIIGWGDWKCGKCDETGHKLCTRKHYFLFWVDARQPDYRECN